MLFVSWVISESYSSGTVQWYREDALKRAHLLVWYVLIHSFLNW